MEQLLKVLIRMRQAQKEYYQMKTQHNLKMAINLEHQADRLIKEYLTGNPSSSPIQSLFNAID